MWGMVGEILRDDTHGRMEKVGVNLCRVFLSDSCFCSSIYLPIAVSVYLTMEIKLLKPI
jgi:hypothetical protein